MTRLNKNETTLIRLTLNGREVEGRASPRLLLSDFLRHELGATGTHVGCEHGVCGACTVRVDGVMARSCLMLAIQAEGAEIDTVEGLSPAPDQLSVLQAAFRRHHALQCGFCTAGILMSLDTLLRDEPEANRDRIEDVVGGHLCRCTGYAPIIAAALEAAEELRGGVHV
ncbi:(2Fe-2S)-binding protein [Sedimentitalea sp. XS_ASV28]|uniref:(2Fe-2S)-binding protein n=1 Tax=Sedimentitalea sp. XS_ASV28 TaxID=3241296 RepID=UPI003517AA68